MSAHGKAFLYLKLERPAAGKRLEVRLARVLVGLDAAQLGDQLLEQNQVGDVVVLELVGNVLEQPRQLDPARVAPAQGARERRQACANASDGASRGKIMSAASHDQRRHGRAPYTGARWTRWCRLP